MGDINTDRKKFGLTRRQFNFFVCISVLLLAFCFSLFIPPIRNLIFRFVEILVHRPINHPYWHKVFIGIGIGGLVLCAFFLEFYLSIISQIIAGRISNIYAITFSLIFVFVFVFAIMYKANWFYIDQFSIIKATAVNKYFPKYSPGNDGRFTPFGWIHYNLLLFVFRCLGQYRTPVEAYYATMSIFFIVTFFCLYFLFIRIEPAKTECVYSLVNCFFACTFIILGGDFFFIYSCLVSFETQVIMMFAVFMLMYHKALKTDKIRYYTIAFLSAIYTTYCKEPVFDVFLVIAFVNYLFRYNKSKREKMFYIALLANGVLFMILYYFLSFKYKSGAIYGQGWVTIRGFEFLLSIITGNPVLIIMFCFGLIRLYFVIVRKERDFLFYDGLLFAGIAYTFPFFILHLNSGYYFLPSIILFLPSLVHWMKYFLGKKRAFAFALFFILLPVYLYNSGHTLMQIDHVRRRQQEYMPYITELLSDYKSGKKLIWYESDNGVTDDTLFMVVRNSKKGVDNDFLNYLNKSEGINFFVVERNMDHITMNQNILFFYPQENDQWQPMPDEISKILQDNNFTLYKFFNGTWTYKQY